MRLLRILAVVAAVLGGGERRAVAIEYDATSPEGIGIAIIYIVPTAASVATGAINATFLAYDEGSPALWRNGGLLAGGVAIAVGTGVLFAIGDSTDGKVLGAIPIAAGAGAVVTSLLVRKPDDIVGNSAMLTPLFLRGGGGGLALSGRF